MQHKRLLLGSFAILSIVVLIVIMLPVRVPYSLSTYGQIIPVREWVLMRSDNGMIVSVLRDNRTGAVRSYTVTQIERGEALSFSIADLKIAEAVTVGDTVAWTTSTDIEFSMASLRGALAVAEAALEAAQSGDKTSLVEEADRRLSYTRKAVEEQEKLHLRQTELHAKNMVSDEEFELSEDRLALLRINVDIARAQLSTVSSGAKVEEVRQRIQEIAAIKGEIDAVRKRMTLSTHVAPISGVLRSSRAADTLLIVEDTTEYLLVMPVRLRDYEDLARGAEVEFHFHEIAATGRGTTLADDGKVHYLNGEAVLLLPARITSCSSAVPSGLIASCTIVCSHLELFAFLHRYLLGILV